MNVGESFVDNSTSLAERVKNKLEKVFGLGSVVFDNMKDEVQINPSYVYFVINQYSLQDRLFIVGNVYKIIDNSYQEPSLFNHLQKNKEGIVFKIPSFERGLEVCEFKLFLEIDKTLDQSNEKIHSIVVNSDLEVHKEVLNPYKKITKKIVKLFKKKEVKNDL